MHMSGILLKTGLLVIAVSAISGCDFFRTLAGRPTSADIAAKKEQIELEEVSHRAMLDSMDTIQRKMVDSLSFADSVRMAGSTIVKAGRLGGLSAAQLSHRYYIVVGSFSNQENAGRQAAAAGAAGYEVTSVEFINGYKAVMLCPSDNLPEIYAKLKTVKKESFCPPDVWVMVNE